MLQPAAGASASGPGGGSQNKSENDANPDARESYQKFASRTLEEQIVFIDFEAMGPWRHAFCTKMRFINLFNTARRTYMRSLQACMLVIQMLLYIGVPGSIMLGRFI